MKKGFCVVVLFLATGLLCAEEGMYLINGLTPQMAAEMRRLGCTLQPGDIWDGQGHGLALAVVNLGATGSFVSAQGLIITNHHVAFGAVQRQSTPEHNYIRDGFLADAPEKEIQAPGYTARVMVGFDNVTPRFNPVFKKGLAPRLRQQLQEKISKQLVAEGEKKKGVECDVASFYGGKEFYLVTYFKIRDVRIVYVPPRSIGEYGGEIDNWMWPRHTGDFSFLRAYVGRDGLPADYAKENIPFQPKVYLKIARQPLAEGDFTMIMGFPGRTYRWYCAAAVGNEVNFNYPQRIDLLKGWIALLEKISASSEAVKIKNAGVLKGLYNSFKNNEGMLAGLRRGGLYQQKLEEEKQLQAWLDSRPKWQAQYGKLLTDLSRLQEERRNYLAATSLLSWMRRGSRFLDWALTIHKWSREKNKKDMAREPGYMQRDIEIKKTSMKIAQSSLDIPSDQAVFAYFLKKMLELPETGVSAVLRQGVATAPGQTMEEKTANWVARLYTNSRLGDAPQRLKMLDMESRALRQQRDAFVELAALLQPELDRLNDKGKELAGEALQSGAALRRGHDAVPFGPERLSRRQCHPSFQLRPGQRLQPPRRRLVQPLHHPHRRDRKEQRPVSLRPG